MRTRNVHYSQRQRQGQRPPIGVIVEATPDPLLGNIGGAEITFGLEDDHQQQQQPQSQQQQQSQQQYDFNFNRMQLNIAGMNDENLPPLSFDGDNLNNTGIQFNDSPTSNKSNNSKNSDEFGSLDLNSSDEDLLTSIENAAYNPLPIQQQQQQPMYTQRTVEGANLLLDLFANDHTSLEAQPQQDDSLDHPANDWDARADQLHDFEAASNEEEDDGEEEAADALTDGEEDDSEEEDFSKPPPDYEKLDKDLLYTMWKKYDIDGNPDPSTKELLGRTKRGKNEGEYCRKIRNALKRFWSTINEHGDDLLRSLLVEVPANYAKGHLTDKRFYNVLGGEKCHYKHKIFNEIFSICVNRWLCTTGKRKGKHLKPGIFEQHMKLISYDFEKKGILYNYKADFNEYGQFHGAAITLWEEQQKKDSKFATKENQKRAPADFMDKMNAAMLDGTLDYKNNPDHLQKCAIAAHGYNCGLRGQKEHSDLPMEHIKFGKFPESHKDKELAGKLWGGVFMPANDKPLQIKLGKTTVDRDVPKMLTHLNNPACPLNLYEIIQLYKSKCHPDALKFYARPAKCNEREKFSKEAGRDVWFCPSGGSNANYNLGKNRITQHTKELADLLKCGVEETDSMTGHALRAMCITALIEAGLNATEVAEAVRHASLNPQKTCAQESQMRANNRIKAMVDMDAKKRSAVDSPEKKPKVVENPYKKKIPFAPGPPPPGMSPNKWERFQQFENAEHAQPECPQRSVVSDNRMQVPNPGSHQQHGQGPPPPPPQCMQGPPPPLPQYMQGPPQYIQGPPPPPQYQNPIVCHQPAPPPYWQGPVNGNTIGNGHGQYTGCQQQYNGYQQIQPNIVYHQPAPPQQYPAYQQQQQQCSNLPGGYNRPMDPPPSRNI